jgi:hypothetical protein
VPVEEAEGYLRAEMEKFVNEFKVILPSKDALECQNRGLLEVAAQARQTQGEALDPPNKRHCISSTSRGLPDTDMVRPISE